MGRVLIRYDGGNVPIVTGGPPPDENTPIDDPTPTRFVTNEEFFADDGIVYFALDVQNRVTPLWCRLQVIQGTTATATFRKVVGP